MESNLSSMNTVGFAYLHIENNRRDEILDDLSTAGFHSVLYDLFSLRSPFRFQDDIPEEVFQQIKLLAWIQELVSMFHSKDSIVISELNNWPNEVFDANEISLNLPAEYQHYGTKAAFWIFLVEKAGIVRRIDEQWFLSKAAKKSVGKPKMLLQMLIEGIGFRMNWSVLDGKAAKETGQLAFGISLILLQKYGSNWRDAMFYTNKYFQFFELAREESHIDNNQTEVDFIQVYIYRTFYCFAKMFNFIEIEDKETEDGIITNIRTNAVFQSLFDFRM